MVKTKSCRPGGHNPPATDEFFYRNRRTGRLRGHCKECRRKDASCWYDKNIERAQEIQRRYREGRESEQAARSLRHYEQNREQVIARVMAQKQADPEAERQRCASKEARRRAQKKIGSAEHVDREIVFERDEGVCGICREPVEKDDFHLDHVVPLSKGGSHTYANVQVAHPSCNLAKSDRLDFALTLIAGGENLAI